MNHSMTIYYQNTPCYDILLQNNFHGLYESLSALSMVNQRICIVTDSKVDAHYGCFVEQYLKKCGCEQVVRFVFPEGEEHKTLTVIEELYEFLIQHDFDRSDVLLALGGGVTGDMTGFAASTYLRGIRFVQLPTTLLSMVDSSIGGKTGVDFKGYKNMVGAFYQPSLVFVNTGVLETLDDRQRASGMGEIIKHGLIKDKNYYEWLSSHTKEVLELNSDALSEMIYRSQLIKKAVVENDPKEKGERALLNFGHTIGHAIEKALNFHLLHGECVALGMVAAAYLSFRRGFIKKEELVHMESVLTAYGLPTRKEGLPVQEILENCRHDKKKSGQIIRFILLKQIGEAFITTDVTSEEIKASVKYLMEGTLEV
ncbi:MAG: 3-dehydroquinate synthase [Lachnospiraceae bacterium]